jgi:hypothetical protein
MKHPIAEMTPENKLKLEKFLLKKLKEVAPVKIEGYWFGTGEVQIVKARVDANWYNKAELHVKIKYVELTPSNMNWHSAHSIGRRRNDRIRSAIQWTNNEYKMIAKAFGLSEHINIETITVKK